MKSEAVLLGKLVKLIQEFSKPFAHSHRLNTSSGPFDIDANFFFYHLVPPSSPLTQRPLSDYIPSHSLSRSASSLRSLVPSRSRSHTTTASVASALASAETSKSECVVTISCVR